MENHIKSTDVLNKQQNNTDLAPGTSLDKLNDVKDNIYDFISTNLKCEILENNVDEHLAHESESKSIEIVAEIDGISLQSEANPAKNELEPKNEICLIDGVIYHKCPKCQYKTPRKYDLQKHLDKKHNEDGVNYSCEECALIFTSKYALKQHVIKTHSNLTLTCIKCSYKTKIEAKLTLHMEKRHSETYSCSKCDYSSSTKFNLKRHVDRMHPDESMTHFCQFCDYKNPSEFNLKVHIHNHHAKEPLKCPKCDYRTNYKGDLKAHIDRKHNESGLIYCCVKCKYTSKTKLNLQRHIRCKHKE